MHTSEPKSLSFNSKKAIFKRNITQSIYTVYVCHMLYVFNTVYLCTYLEVRKCEEDEILNWAISWKHFTLFNVEEMKKKIKRNLKIDSSITWKSGGNENTIGINKKKEVGHCSYDQLNRASKSVDWFLSIQIFCLNEHLRFGCPPTQWNRAHRKK